MTQSFEAQARRTPDAIAVVDDRRRVQYRELSARAAALARRLRQLGVDRDDRVAVYMDRSVEQIVCLLAILDAGAAYVPIDTSYPAERVAAVLAHASPRVVITNEPLPGPAALFEPLVMPPDGGGSCAPAGAAPSDEASLTADRPDDLAYVVYTSGSTGTPKGVAMTRRGLSHLIAWQIADGPASLTTLQFTATGFDVVFQEVFSTLCTGGTLVLPTETMRRDPMQLIAGLDHHGVERLFLPYTALQQLADAAVRSGRVPGSLRHVITAGEQLIVTEALARFFAALPGCRLDNQYGPTETHLVTRHTLAGAPATWDPVTPIGTVVGHARLYCLDEHRQPVPPGTAGELYVGGDGLARGYLDDASQTAERFVADPFRRVPHARMYRTGDLGRIGVDGVAHFLGRADDQIKVRGVRIEPAEVELALAAHPAVRSAAVALAEVAPGVKALVGYVVGDGSAVTPPEIALHVRQRLPEYLVPARIVFVDTLPRTATGKLDRRQLAAMVLPPEPVAAVAGTSTPDLVRAIWTRVLGHDEFDTDDDFFDVGGDSLLATWVLAELRLATGRDLALSTLLDDATVRGIAAHLAGPVTTPPARASGSAAVTLQVGSSSRVLYLLHPLGGELLCYRELARHIRSPLRVVGLRWDPPQGDEDLALEELAARHASLIRSIQPAGPYLLAGWSFGGVLAWEVARQLHAGGGAIEFLGLIDAHPTHHTTTATPASETTIFSPLQQAFADEMAVTHLSRALRLAAGCMRAAMTYDAPPHHGAVDLFQPAGSPPALQARLHSALRPLVSGPLRIHDVPGDHYSMLRAPHAAAIAAALDAALIAGRAAAPQLQGTAP